MASPTTDFDYETFAWNHRMYRSVFLSGLVILLYDYSLNLGSEGTIIWSSPMRPSKCWFFAVRCSTMERVLEGLLLLQDTLVQFMLGLRVFALYGFNRMVLLSMSITAGLAFALGAWTIIGYGNPQMLSAPGMFGCHTDIPRITAFRLAGTSEAQLAYDALVFGLTLYRARADHAAMSLIPGSLIERMACDGAMYFGIILLAKLANVLSLYFGDIIIAGILSWWGTSLSVTLLSRLILNLQRAGVGNFRSLDVGATEVEGIHFVGQSLVAPETDA
ncbi:hypothetical protein B0H14DRAFT_3659193 [Mycena olivaceomarginata]|nr:hypothetical protein B0H14DRAFT_3659193 [Mycena olivaceomarginata]